MNSNGAATENKRHCKTCTQKRPFEAQSELVVHRHPITPLRFLSEVWYLTHFFLHSTTRAQAPTLLHNLKG